ncbi:MAG: DNA repair protein RadC [Rhodospirillaceae bacterium]|nr:DNA repair protein RadC [Rhodospirillaceae bacterium]
MTDAPEKPHHLGHRERLRRRVLDRGADSLADYELLEYLLFGVRRQGDTKPTAEALIDRFGSIAGVLAAPTAELAAVKGVSEATIALIAVTAEAARRAVREEIADGPVLSSWSRLIDYLRVAMGHNRTEEFRLLFLDSKNRLIADEVQGTGTVNRTAVYPREVVKRALEHGATAIIMVHNHPSGDPTPSRADVEMTEEVRDARALMGIVLHDHVVISKSGHESFKSMGLL